MPKEPILPLRELLADYAWLVAKHGADSIEARDFAYANAGNREFVELAKTVRMLRGALKPSHVMNGGGGRA